MKEAILYGGKVKLFFDGANNRHSYFKENGERIKKSVSKVVGVMDKPALKFWAANIGADHLYNNWNAQRNYAEAEKIMLCREVAGRHTQYKEEEAVRGKAVHKFAEDYVNGINPKLPEDERASQAAIAFTKFWDQTNLTPISKEATEAIVYSLKLDVIGTADLICERKNKGKPKSYHIVDYKAISIYKKCRAWELKEWLDGFARDKSGLMIKYPVFLGPRMQTAAYRSFKIEEEPKLNWGESYVIRFDKDLGDFDETILPSEEQEKAAQAFAQLAKVADWIDEFEVKY